MGKQTLSRWSFNGFLEWLGGAFLLTAPFRAVLGWLAHRMDVSKSDIVLYAKYTCTEVEIDNKKFLIMKKTDVLAIVQ